VPATPKQTQLTPQQALMEKSLQAVLLKNPLVAMQSRAPGQPPARLLNRLGGGSRPSASSVATEAAASVNNLVANVIQPRKTRAQLLLE